MEERPDISLTKLLLPVGKASGLMLEDFAGLPYPKDEIRFAHSIYLFARATEFLLFHEIGHIVRCHLQYLQKHELLMADKESGALTMLEFEKKIHANQEVRRILECDADSVATSMQLNGILQQPLSLHKEFSLAPVHIV